MNVGDYVRTPKGMTKIINIRDEIIRNSANGNEVVLETRKYITDNDFCVSNDYKSSPRIVDLIEVGDYLNGWRVNSVERNSDDKGTIIKIGNTTFNVLDNEEIYTPVQENDSYYQRIEKLKLIVTKEQFESMEYKIWTNTLIKK